ncbi:MAG: Gfo/Idh/MocA family oxidoreductase [Candidatus Margulisiibacteriota bacterium]
MKTIAVVGLGVMGKNHVTVLGQFPGIRIVLADALVKNHPAGPVYATHLDLLAQEKVDAAIVAVPTQFHYAVARSFIEQGIPTLIEKPVATTPTEAQSLIELRNTHKTPLVVGHVERFNPAIQALKHALHGTTIRAIHIQRLSPFPARIQDVGILADLAVHDLDLIRFLGSTISEIAISKQQWVHATQEDYATLVLKTQSGISGLIQTHWHSPMRRRLVEVFTENGLYQADLLTQELTFSEPHHNGHTVQSKYVKKGEALRLELAAFLGLCENPETPTDLATLEDGKITLELIS